jgi:hypothetical protein
MPDQLSAPSCERYLQHIASYEREFKQWEGRVGKILKRYRDESRDGRRGAGESRFNVLWSNVQTLKAATFARMPQADVSRRFRDNDPVGRVAAMMLERALDYEINHYADFGASLRQCVYDRFLGGRGVAWVRYEPVMTQGETQITEDEESQFLETLSFEQAPVDYVHWRDFGHSVARTWEEVQMVWRRVYMTRPMLRERFPELADQIPLDASPDEQTRMKMTTDEAGVNKRALVFEIWDKETNQAVWLSKSLNKLLDVRDDPLDLEEFFPCPRPIFATLTTDTLVPLPDFTLYQDQANELDILSDRIDGLVKALQVKGGYDASIPELSRLFTEGDNGTLIPVKNWAAFAEKKGLEGSISLVDLQPIAMALREAYGAFEQIKGQIYELTGISDILRGQTAPSETATAQQIKNSYASLRLKVYQDEVERFAAGLLRLKAQIICKHFSPETICQISSCDQLSPEDQQVVPYALQMLKSDVIRGFRIEISTDSMVYQDEQQEKQDRLEFLSATSSFMEKIVQSAQVAPQLVPIGVEMLKFGVGGFRVGKSLEGVIDQAAEQMKQQAAQPQQPHPDPEAMKAQAAAQQAQMVEQNKAQMLQQTQQHEAALEQMRLQAKAQADQLQLQQNAAIEQMKAQAAVQASQLDAQQKATSDAQRLEFDRWKAQLDAETKVLVAQIGAQAKEVETSAEQLAEGGVEEPSPNAALAAAMAGFTQALSEMRAPRTIIRGPDGRAAGIA